ncbi:MAG: GHKL domain-containing protein [Lachnospiraceae bacterium]|nr:GHKL domain-containing protein [Lachnospiraceae bacterium]
MTLTLDIIPFMILFLNLFKSKLPCSMPVAVMKLILPIVAYNTIICITYMNGMYGPDIMVGLRVMGSPLAYVLLCLTFKNYYLPFAYKCLYTLPCMLGVLQMSAFCINYINVENAPEFMVMTILRFGFYLVLGYPYYKMEKSLLVANFDMDDKRVWSYFAISQFLLNVAMIVCVRNDYASNGIAPKDFVLQMVMLVATMSVTAILFYAFKMSRNVAMIKDKQMRDELLLELNTRQYNSIQDNITKTKQVRHDIRHHLRTIRQMIAEERYSEVRKYLDEYEASIPEGTKIKFCDNLTINALLEYYFALAEDKNIEVSFDVAELADCNINDIDLNILLGNALENAIEASENVADEKRSIKLCAKKKAGSIFITIDNVFDRITKNKNGVLLSKKRDYKESGYGNASIDAVAEKYNGQIKREINGNRYQVSIILNVS